MRQASTVITVRTKGAGLDEITGTVGDWVAAQGMRDGLLTLFVRHSWGTEVGW